MSIPVNQCQWFIIEPKVENCLEVLVAAGGGRTKVFVGCVWHLIIEMIDPLSRYNFD